MDADKNIFKETNHSGGILGGITTGMPIVLRAAFKPTPSIGQEQRTVDLETMEDTTLTVVGRHDPCVVVRAVPVVESAVALKNGYALGIALTIGLNQRAFGVDSELHFNSQAAIFGQSVKEMAKLLAFQKAGTLENLSVGLGDLYVTVYGGRTRLVGILLGRGLTIDEAKAELNGVTLESLVVAERVARAVRISAAAGVLKLEDFPLLMHVDEIICQKKEVNIPWEAFTFTYEA